MAVLAQGAIFEITVDDRIVRCAVTNRPDVLPSDGAAAAREMQRILREDVLPITSPYRGAILDVRDGPSIFGPETRAALASMFAFAEQNRKPLVALVGDSAMQRLQFNSLVREAAPFFGTVVERLHDARSWVERR